MIHFSLMHQDALKYCLNKTDSAGHFKVPPSQSASYSQQKTEAELAGPMLTRTEGGSVYFEYVLSNPLLVGTCNAV